MTLKEEEIAKLLFNFTQQSAGVHITEQNLEPSWSELPDDEKKRYLDFAQKVIYTVRLG